MIDFLAEWEREIRDLEISNFQKTKKENPIFSSTLDPNISTFLSRKFEFFDPMESTPYDLQLSCFDQVEKGNKSCPKMALK